MENNIKEIETKMLEVCNEYGFQPTQNLSKIAKAKDIMFTIDTWDMCPCDCNNIKRFCISVECYNDIVTKGVCHCNCYKLKENFDDI